jgi:hypothetical protein
MPEMPSRKLCLRPDHSLSSVPHASLGDSPGASPSSPSSPAAPQSSAADKSPAPGTIDKKRRIRRQVDSDSSSDESLDIV